MQLVDVLRVCQGDTSNRQFAERLGISRSMLDKIYQQIRSPGLKVLQALAKEFPEKQGLIWRVFLAENKDNGPVLESIVRSEEPAS